MKRVLSIFFVFALTLAANAGERLPGGMLAHVSAKSFSDLVASLDALAVASVKNTPAAKQYQPGMLPMMAGSFSPFPQSAWDAKAELHAVAVVAQPMNPQPVLLLKTSGIAAFKKGMTGGGVKLAGDDKKMSGAIPQFGGGTWYFADAGGGVVACSPNEAARDFVVKALAAGWSPKHAGAADLAINLDMKNLLAVYKPIYDAYMGQAKQALAKDGGGNPDKPLAVAMSKVAARALVAFESEAPALNNFGIDLSFSGDRLKLTFSLTGDKGSGVDNLRAAYAVGEPPKYALAKSLPKETVLVDTLSDISKLPDGWVKFHEDALRDLAGTVMPDKAGEMAALPRKFLALGIKDYTAGSYLAGDRPVMAFYFEHANAKGIQDFLPGALKLCQDFSNNLIKLDGGDKARAVAIVYQAQAGKLGNVPYQRINFQFRPAAGAQPVSYDVLFALGGKTVAAVYGQVNERDLHYAIDNYQRPAGAFIDSEPAKKSMADISNRQIKFVECRPLEALANFYVGQAALTGTDPGAARAAVAELQVSQSCMALASGATDKLLTLEWVIPTEVVGDFIRNSNKLSNLGRSITSAPSSGSAEKDSEDEGESWDTQGAGEAGDADAPAPFDIQLAQSSFGPDDDAEVTVTGVTEQMSKDSAFVAVYKARAPHKDRISFFRLSQGENVSTFYQVNLDPGEYEMRVYRKEGEFSDAGLLGASAFTVEEGDGPPTLKLSKSTFRAGADRDIPVTVRGVTKRLVKSKAFVALHKAGAPQNQIEKQYSPVRKNTTMLFEVPKKNGNYEIRFHKKEKDFSTEGVIASIPLAVTGNAE